MRKFTLVLLTLLQIQFFYSQSSCTSPNAIGKMDVNNVGLEIGPSGHTGFDLQLQQAGYEAPIGSNTFSIFAMSSWIGGLGPNQQLKFAGQIYRQDGDSFWPGPLPNNGSLSINSDICADYDNVWEIYKDEVDLHKEYFDRVEFDALNGTNTASEPPFQNGYSIPVNILSWPGTNPDPNYETDLAPYIDRNGNGLYNGEDGDYPAFYYPDQGQPDIDFHLFGNKAMWWIYNDVGNVHQELPADPLGVEFQCLAYAFSDVTGLENVIFFRNKVSNRSTQTISNTFLGQWVDGDVGCYFDDYIACHVQQSLGFTYNGDLEDEDCIGNLGYGTNPPAVGTDLLKGPPADLSDGIDNNLNGEIDEENEYWTMSRFTYFENSTNPLNGNPNNGLDAYNLMSGFWKNGQAMTYGGQGMDPTGIPSDFVYPAESDPEFIGTDGQDPGYAWTEFTDNNPPGDRRYMQSAGPFTFEAGESFNTHSALIWAQSDLADDSLSADEIINSDLFVQEVFDSTFDGLLTGILTPEETANCNITIQNVANGEIQFNLDAQSKTVVSLYTIEGRLLHTVLETGNKKVGFDDIPAGIYLLRLENEQELCSQKLFIR